jgi:NAD+ kinase
MLLDKDLLVAVGGDGTTLNCASFIDDTIPLLGINSDPSTESSRPACRENNNRGSAHRRSTGKLCAASSLNAANILPQVIHGDYPEPTPRTRIQCIVQSTNKETRLPPALNDILLAHSSPAAVSRMQVSLAKGNVKPSFHMTKEDEGSK